ncbi:AAA family ATPase [Pelagibius litoralis]|uniref:AAA family ATPase n=1 Tax=Pelagibius litoralis TaxID=374515 RepID=A0A967C1W5_9PROT|nr:AAA family ATPase [Pelagibius litoralis]NIA67208.1 AAA family ATPase [Pelagibius litoralis]
MTVADRVLEHQVSNATAAECVAFVGDNQTHSVVDSVLREFFAEPLLLDGGPNQAIEFLSSTVPPSVLIVDVSEAASPQTAMLSLRAAIPDTTKIIGIGTVNDIAVYREIVESGATDYLVKPVTEKALASAINRTEDTNEPAVPEIAVEERARIAVIGSRGGVGSSTLAVNLAWILGEERKHKTVLVDLDLEFGTIALSLDIEPTRGLREALENPARVDGLFISSATAKLTEHLSIMATEENLTSEINFNPNAVDALFEALGRINDAIVIDVPRPAYAIRRRVFELATEILLVTELNLSGLRDSLRLLAGIREVAPETPVRIIANRAAGPKQAMQLKDFQRALEHKVDLVLPDEPKAFNAAANTGKPLAQASANAKVCKIVRKLAKEIKLPEKRDPKSDKSSKRRGLGDLFRKR